MTTVDDRKNQACEMEKHQASWKSFLDMKGRNQFLGYQRILREKMTENAAKDYMEAEEEEELVVENEDEDGGIKRLGNTFSFGKTSAIAIFVYACGTVSFSSLYNSVDSTEISRLRSLGGRSYIQRKTRRRF
jgi:hypothetical protein